MNEILNNVENNYHSVSIQASYIFLILFINTAINWTLEIYRMNAVMTAFKSFSGRKIYRFNADFHALL